MNLYDMLSIYSSIFWFVFGIRQFNGKWGWFLFILGISDIITFSGYKLIHLPVSFFSLTSSLLQILAIYYLFFDKNKKVILPTSLLLIIPGIYLSHVIISSISSFVSLLIFFFFIREFIVELFQNKKLNLFFAIFSTYLLITVIKIIMLRIGEWEVVDLYYMATIFQTIIMIPFLFIRHDDERLSININKVK